MLKQSYSVRNYKFNPNCAKILRGFSKYVGKTAVITGAGSGFGAAFAKKAADQGMNLVLADIQVDNLKSTAELLNISPDRLKYVQCDVSQEQEVKNLADLAFDEYGGVHLLFNNAGVAHSHLSWEHTTTDWEWVLGANLWSVIHAHKQFIPRMIKQNQECHIVNTASAAGLITTPGCAAYTASKHAVVALSETLYYECQDCKYDHMGVSVLCPGFVPTNIAASERPKKYSDTRPHSGIGAQYALGMQNAVAAGSSEKRAQDIAEDTFDAIEAKRLYILPHPKIGKLIRMRACDIAAQVNPAVTPRLSK